MKKTFLALAILGLSNLAMAHGAGAVAVGTNSLISGSVASVSATGTGAASATAFNQGLAASGVDTSGSAGSSFTAPVAALTHGKGTVTTTFTKSGDVSVSGYTVTRNISGVQTTQSGDASAIGAAGGIAKADAAGVGAFHTVNNGPEGNVAGASSALTATGVISVGNGAYLQNAGMTSSFGAGASADITTTDVVKIKYYVVPVGYAQSDVKNTRTDVDVDAGSNGGFTGVTWPVNAGTATGGTINNASASALANASVSGVVVSGTAGR